MEVNGKFYNLWGQFVEKQDEFKGGVLEYFGDSMDYMLMKKGTFPISTKITGIELVPNGETSAMFKILGEDFNCGGDVHYIGIIPGEDPWITFSGYGSHKFRIKKHLHK